MTFTTPLLGDETAPQVVFTAPPALTTDTSPPVSLSFTDDQSGVDAASFALTLDGVDITANCTVTAAGADCTTPVLTEASHLLSASLADLAGNVATADLTFQVTSDATPPSLAVTAPTGTVVDDTTPAVTVTFSDAESGIDTSSLLVAVDGFDITGSCVLGSGTATCEPPALREGQHTVTAQVADVAGNVTTASGSFVLDLNLTDTVPPSLAVTAPAAPVTDDPAPAITVTYSDAESDVDVTTLDVAVDGFSLVADGRCTVGTASAACAPPLLGSGTHTVTATITDLAGNPATAAASFDLSYTTPEATAPVVAITEPSQTTVFDDLTPQITVEYSDAAVAGSLTGVAILTLAVDVDGTDITAGCAVGDASAVCEPPPLTVDTHVVTATVEDLHGNVGTASFGFDVVLTTPDTTPPAIAVAEPSATPVTTDVVPIRVTYADAETGVDLASLAINLDAADITSSCTVGPAEAACTSPVLAEGSHTVDATVQDLAGNPASDSFTFQAVLGDSTPPQVTWVEPTGTILDDTTPTVTVSYTDADSGVDTSTLRIWVDTLELTGCTVGAASATCEPPPLGDGGHVGRVEIRDMAGNLGTVENTFYRQLDLADQDPPSVSVTAPASSIVVDDPSPEIRVAYSDAGSGVDLTSVLVLVDGIALVEQCNVGPAEAVCEPPDLAQGSHVVEGRVADLADNSAVASSTFEIQLTNPETDPPLLDVLSPTGTLQDDTNPQIQLQYSDAGSGIALSSLVVEVDGIPVTSACQAGAASAVCPSPTLAAGSHQVDAQISDLAGNLATDQSLFDVVLTGGDSTPPTVTVDSPLSVVRSDTARFTVLYTDAESGVSLAGVVLSLDGAPLSTGCSIDLNRAFCDLVMLTDGAHTASASVPDLEGNTTTVDHPFTVELTPPDTVAPNVAVLEPALQVVDDPQPTIQVEYSDAGSGLDTATVAIALDGLDVTSGCTVGAAEATCTPAALGAGSHVVDASVADLEGNLGSASLTFDLVLTPADLVAPTVTVVEPSTATVPEGAPVSLELSYSDDASGIDPASLSVIVDATDVSAGCQRNSSQAICPLGVLALGVHTADVGIADAAGNLGSASAGFEVVAETAPPVLDVVTPTGDVVRGDATPEVRIEYSDAVSGIDTATLAVTLDGADLVPACVVDAASAVCEPQALAPGVHQVLAQIADVRGNVATASRTFEVSLDLEIAIAAPATGFLTSDDAIDVSGAVSPEAESVTLHGVAGVISGDSFTISGVALHRGDEHADGDRPDRGRRRRLGDGERGA